MAKKTKITKEDLKQPDTFVSTTDKIALWIKENQKVVLGVIVVIVGAALAQTATKHYTSSQRDQAEAQLFPLKKQLNDKLEELAKDKTKTKDKGLTAEKTPEVFAAHLKPLSDSYITAIKANSQSPSLEHALSHAHLLSEYGQTEAAIDLLKTKSSQGKSLLEALLNLKLGTLYANQGSFDEAVTYFDKVLTNKEHKSLFPDVYLKKALSLEKAAKIDEAKTIYELLKKDHGDTAEGRSATTYLRLLEIKGNS